MFGKRDVEGMVRQYWMGLKKSEQSLLFVLGFFLVGLGLGRILWWPAYHTTEEMETQLPKIRAQWEQVMGLNQALLYQVSSGPQKAVSGTGLTTYLRQNFKEPEASFIVHVEQKQIQIMWHGGPFSDLMENISRLHHRFPVRVVGLSVRRKQGSEEVSGEVILGWV